MTIQFYNFIILCHIQYIGHIKHNEDASLENKNGVDEDSSLLGCYTVSIGKESSTFRKSWLLPSSVSNQSYEKCHFSIVTQNRSQHTVL